MRIWVHASVLALAMLCGIVAGSARAADQEILGKQLLIRDPTGAEAERRVVLVAKESGTDIAALVGNPVADGAMLMFGVNSGSSGDFFFLEASGWSATPTGFRYVGPTDFDADPVAKVILRRTPAGKALLKIVIRGNVGTQPVTLVPPNPGSDAVAMLLLANGDAYCASFGGAAGGQIVSDDASTWKIRNATQQPACPQVCCSLGSVCAWGGTSSIAECAQQGGIPGFPGTACDGATGACAPPPAASGSCCEFSVAPFCFGGPGVQQPPCDEFGGTFSSNAICDPSGSCVSVPPP